MREDVRTYYSKTLTSSSDLKSDACCEISAPTAEISEALGNIHAEVSARYYGCGLVAPDGLAGKRILDLGCGAGRDAFLLAQLAGPEGEVIGVDMTDEQLAVARTHEAWHAERFGFDRPNTRFLKGYIEELDTLGIEAGSIDVVVSNCVINLSIDKPAVFAGVRRLLRPGAIMHFADVYAERSVPGELRTDPVLYGECLAGALSWAEFLDAAKTAGFAAPALVDHRPLAISDAALLEKLEGLRFVSATVELRPAAAPGEGWDRETADPFTAPASTAAGSSCCG